MMAHNKGDLIVFALDIGKSMLKIYDHQTALEKAKECILLIIERKIFLESKDKIAVILIGDESAKDMPFTQKHIKTLEEFQEASWKLYETVRSIECSNLSTDCILENGILTAVNLLMDTDHMQERNPRILFLSNFDGYCYNFDIATENIKENGICLNFVGPVEFSKEIKTEKIPEEILPVFHILDWIKDLNGDTFTFSDVSEPLSMYEVKTIKSMPSNLPLEIGTLTIPVSVYVKIAEYKPRSWSSACAHGDGAQPKKVTTCYMNDEKQTKVSPEDCVYAYKYGTTVVPYTEDDKKNMEYPHEPRGMKILGFTKAINVSRRYDIIGAGAKYVYGQKNDESAQNALAAFIHALHETNMVGIVRFISTPRSAPIIGFLSPRIKKKSECLAFITLPYLEDIRHYKFPSLSDPSAEQLCAIDELITTMDLTKGTDAEILKPKDICNPYVQRLFHCLRTKALYPNQELPPLQPRILQLVNPEPYILKRAEPSLKNVQHLFPLKDCVHKNLSKTESPLFPQRKSGEAATQNIKNKEDPERFRRKKSTYDVGKHIYWLGRRLDDNIKKICENNSKEKRAAPETDSYISPNKKSKASTSTEADESDLIDAMTDKITEVGTINPIRDIQYLSKYGTMKFSEICRMIDDVLIKLLDDKEHIRFNYPKILSVIKEYRSLSLKEDKAHAYNEFMSGYHVDFAKNSQLWNEIEKEKLGQITEIELPSSGTPSEVAEKYYKCADFIRRREHSKNTPAPCVEEDDENDLMDQL